jgi:DNA-binding LacI/PurR family transcriptional regulator
MPTILDVAEKAGVSRSTVSRVLTNSNRVGQETKQKVLAAMKELGYQPSRAAQVLRNKKTMLIAVLVPRIANSIFAELLQGIESEAAKYQYHVLLCNTDYNAEKELHYLQMLQNGQVDGIIMTSYHNNIDVIRQFQRFGSIVFAGEYIEKSIFPTVAIDHREAAYQVTEHLIKNGYTSIGMVNGPLASIIPRDREKGFLKAMADYNIPVNREWVIGLSFGIQYGQEYMKTLLTRGTLPTAVFAANDELAVGVIQEAKETGIRVPEDLAVVGFDDQPMATIINPKLTTIQQPIRQLGAKAIQLMIRAFNSGLVEREILETKLVIRKSCGTNVMNE